MTRLLTLLFLSLFFFSAHAKKSDKITSSFKYSQFSVQQKKKKLILSCKPIKAGSAAVGNIKWISECNNIAFNLLTQEKYQKILVEKDIDDHPFGRTSYQRALESNGSNMKKKSIRKAFKIN